MVHCETEFWLDKAQQNTLSRSLDKTSPSTMYSHSILLLNIFLNFHKKISIILEVCCFKGTVLQFKQVRNVIHNAKIVIN
jgi:hypothetical protein